MHIELDQCLEIIKKGCLPSDSQVVSVLDAVSAITQAEPNLLRLRGPITLVGDVHGQYFDMLELIRKGGQPGPVKYLFLGDYVDRGYHSVQTILTLILYKIKNPQRVHLLRGNHQSKSISKTYGFYEELTAKYGNPALWKHFSNFFQTLPIAAVVNDQIFVCHGGLSPQVLHVDSLLQIDRFVEPQQGAIMDLLWSDPSEQEKAWRINCRGAGWLFGRNPTLQFCNENGLKTIIRSHQLVQEGFKYLFQGKLCTIWSAPNYCYQCNNKAVGVRVNQQQRLDYIQFQASPKSKRSVSLQSVISYFL